MSAFAFDLDEDQQQIRDVLDYAKERRQFGRAIIEIQRPVIARAISGVHIP